MSQPPASSRNTASTSSALAIPLNKWRRHTAKAYASSRRGYCKRKARNVLLYRPRRRAEACQRTAIAGGLACSADGAAMQDQAMGQVQPFLRWDELHKVLLDFNGILLRGPAQAGGQPRHVCIDNKAF